MTPVTVLSVGTVTLGGHEGSPCVDGVRPVHIHDPTLREGGPLPSHQPLSGTWTPRPWKIPLDDGRLEGERFSGRDKQSFELLIGLGPQGPWSQETLPPGHPDLDEGKKEVDPSRPGTHEGYSVLCVSPTRREIWTGYIDPLYWTETNLSSGTRVVLEVGSEVLPLPLFPVTHGNLPL